MLSCVNVGCGDCGRYKNIMGVTHLIANYSLIGGAKSGTYILPKRGTHPIYHDTFHFFLRAISKSATFVVGFDENHPYI